MEIMKLSRRGLDKGWLRKRGSILRPHVEKLEPRDGMSAIYMVPISAMEVAGSNRNGDYWPETGRKVRTTDPREPDHRIQEVEEGLKERHGTFVTHAHMYRDHDNDDPEKASGEIVAADYNEPMGRVEAIAFVDNDIWDNDLHRLASNENTGVSMSARVPHDICIVCGNKASRRSDYCVHARHYMNAILSDGTQVGVVNERPTFFDISGVRLNADRLGFALEHLKAGPEKAASAGRDRRGVLAKLADMEKKLTIDNAQRIGRVVDPRVEPPVSDVTISIIKSYDPRLVGTALKKKRIVLGPDKWLQVVSDESEENCRRMADSIANLLPRLFQSMNDKAEELTSVMEPLPGATIPCGLDAALERIAPDFGLSGEHRKVRLERSTERRSDPPEVIVARLDSKEASAADGLAREYGRYLLAMADGAPAEVKSAIVASNRLER